MVSQKNHTCEAYPHHHRDMNPSTLLKYLSILFSTTAFAFAFAQCPCLSILLEICTKDRIKMCLEPVGVYHPYFGPFTPKSLNPPLTSSLSSPPPSSSLSLSAPPAYHPLHPLYPPTHPPPATSPSLNPSTQNTQNSPCLPQSNAVPASSQSHPG